MVSLGLVRRMRGNRCFGFGGKRYYCCIMSLGSLLKLLYWPR
jgi:hypothetical protein